MYIILYNKDLSIHSLFSVKPYTDLWVLMMTVRKDMATPHTRPKSTSRMNVARNAVNQTV